MLRELEIGKIKCRCDIKHCKNYIKSCSWCGNTCKEFHITRILCCKSLICLKCCKEIKKPYNYETLCKDCENI